MSQDQNAQDPLDFVRGMWNSMGFSLPGMVTPTLDVDELDKRITDMKAVEGWLKMNLNMLQMSIQGLEMQRAAISAVKAMSQHASGGDTQGADNAQNAGTNPFAAAAAMWPWNMMNGTHSDEGQVATDTTAKPAARGGRRKAPADK